MDPLRVGVLGHGETARGIAELAAVRGLRVRVIVEGERSVEEAKRLIEEDLSLLAGLGRLRGGPGEALSNMEIVAASDEAFRDLEVIVEALDSAPGEKLDTIGYIDSVLAEDSIIISSPPTLNPRDLVLYTAGKERVMQAYFAHHPLIMGFAELETHRFLRERVAGMADKLMGSLGVKLLKVRTGYPGGLSLRILASMISSILGAAGGGDPALYDSVYYNRLSCNRTPLQVADIHGLEYMKSVFAALRAEGMKLEGLQDIERLIGEGRLGLRSGRGFYRLGERVRVPLEDSYKVDISGLISAPVNEASLLMEEGAISPEDVDEAVTSILGCPWGLLEVSDNYGLESIASSIRSSLEEQPSRLLASLVESGSLGVASGRGFYEWSSSHKPLGPVHYERRGLYSVITMERGERLNALNEDMWRGLREALEEALEDPYAESVILTGVRGAFSSGDDIAVMASWRGDEGRRFFANYVEPVIDILAKAEKPLIAAVDGVAAGGGMEILLLFDVVIASDASEFSIPEGLIGAIPPIATTIGYIALGKRVFRYALTGERMGAWEAKDLGLVDIVVPRSQLMYAAIETALKISRLSPRSMRLIKKVKSTVLKEYERALKYSMKGLASLTRTMEFREATKAFIEKRPPKWFTDKKRKARRRSSEPGVGGH